jgi:hypothetical protein
LKPWEGHAIRILAVDPGTSCSALVLFEDGVPVGARLIPNEEALEEIRGSGYDRLVVEMIASFGMPVGAEVFETCLWLGRFIEASKRPHTLVYRKDVKLHLCGSVKAKDSNIRQALIDRFGPTKEKAVGKKASPGPLYGIANDLWSAVAVGVTYLDKAVGPPSSP